MGERKKVNWQVCTLQCLKSTVRRGTKVVGKTGTQGLELQRPGGRVLVVALAVPLPD